jgi:hypothetical protein
VEQGDTWETVAKKHADSIRGPAESVAVLDVLVELNSLNPQLLPAGSRWFVKSETARLDQIGVHSLEDIANWRTENPRFDRTASGEDDYGTAAPIAVSVADIVRHNKGIPLNPNVEHPSPDAPAGNLLVPYLVRLSPALNANDHPAVANTKAGQSLSQLAEASDCSLEMLAISNQYNRLLLVENATVSISRSDGSPEEFAIQANDTLASLAERLPVESVSDLAHLIADQGGLLQPNELVLAPPAPVKLSLDIDEPPYAEHIFPLTVHLQIQRTENIHPEMADSPAVQTARSQVHPELLPGNGDANRAQSLEIFAAEFEAALPHLKLATGQAKRRRHRTRDRSTTAAKGFGANRGDAPALWVVWLQTPTSDAAALGAFEKTEADDPSKTPFRYKIDTENVRFFGLPPLSVTPQARKDVPIDLYEPGKGLTDRKRIDIQDVDMDVWAREFLAVVDNLLKAENAVTAAKENGDAFRRIMKAKGAIAEAIVKGVAEILDGTTAVDPAALGDAKQALEQRVLIRLSTAYEIDAIVQYAVKVTSPFDNDDTAPRLSGQPIAANDTVRQDGSAEFTMSSAKVPLSDGNSRLTFLFDAANAGQHRHMPLELNYSINEVEFDIGAVDGIQGYQSSAWLNFVAPIRMPDSWAVDIPIPLRTYPIPPTLVGQGGNYRLGEPLEKLMDWEYSFTFDCREAAQDTLTFHVEYNVPHDRAQSRGMVPTDLLHALATFHHVYPAISSELDQLSSVSPPATISTALDALATLVEGVANTWTDWQLPEANVLSRTASPPFRRWSFDARGDADLRIAFNFGVNSPLDDAPKPKLSETGTRRAGPKKVAVLQPRKIATFGFRNILDYQNAWGGVQLSRNKDLIEGRVTHARFVYNTPEVRFSNIMVPLVVDGSVRDIALLPQTRGGAKPDTAITQPLAKHLQVLLEQLIHPSVINPFGLRISCSYGYFLVAAAARPSPSAQRGTTGLTDLEEADDSDQALVSGLPVAMIPRIEFSVGNNDEKIQKTAAMLAEALENWEQRNHPKQEGAVFLFDIDVLTTGQDTIQPLMQISNLRLHLRHIPILRSHSSGLPEFT